ncbi:MAG: DUF411 domain-containing protein [Myxococcales bacterium]|nr:DUF411 domain-containing protein [Myxococcales bacterium]
MRLIRMVSCLAALSALLCAAAVADEPTRVTVYKSATCGCCKAWVRHLEASGFDVEMHDVDDLKPLKAEHGVPSQLASCHTALVDGYVIEGHVPASDIARLLAQRPKVVGLSVPGMPIGSPGMEGPNPEPYRVLAFDAEGRTEVFASHEP